MVHKPYIPAIIRIMKELDRITMNPRIMTGRPCIRGMRITVGTIIGLVAAGHSWAEIRQHYPEIEDEDIRQALQYAQWRCEEREVDLAGA